MGLLMLPRRRAKVPEWASALVTRAGGVGLRSTQGARLPVSKPPFWKGSARWQTVGLGLGPCVCVAWGVPVPPGGGVAVGLVPGGLVGLGPGVSVLTGCPVSVAVAEPFGVLLAAGVSVIAGVLVGGAVLVAVA